ncbi:hypothetical protein MXB_3431, partial [Myxobolus squamalis]
YLDVEKELLERQKLNIYNGGFSYRSNFIWQQKIAIIIPFRNRDTQINTFLNHMHPFLIKQKLNYRIFVVEQVENSTFNRAMLLNIGFVESLKYDFFNCFIFHDVDLLPENDHNIYGCENAPSHFSVAIDTMNYTLPYPSIFGGVEAFTKSQFMSINGFSNLFWGWGGEDDDLYDRTIRRGFKLHRPPEDIARYKMNKINHTTDYFMTEQRQRLGNYKSCQETDGLNTLIYDPIIKIIYKLYTLLIVEI